MWRAAVSSLGRLEVQCDQAGKRNCPLSDAVPGFSEDKMDDLPLVGDRSFIEASGAIPRTSASCEAYHPTWKQESGIAPGSSLGQGPETSCRSFRLSHEFDQLDFWSLAARRLLIRRMIRIAVAVSRNSKAPDFTGLVVTLSSVTVGPGAVLTRGFHKCVADRNEFRARIMKSEMLRHEERGIAKRNQKGEDKGERDKEVGRGGADASSAGQG